MKFQDLTGEGLFWGILSIAPWSYALLKTFPRNSYSPIKVYSACLLGLLGGILSTYLILEVNPLLWPEVDVRSRPKSILTQTVHIAFIQAGMVEESFKIFFILGFALVFFRSNEDTKLWSPLIFLLAGFTALGFALIENSYYIGSEIPERRLETFLGRTVHSSNIHLLINLCFALFCLKANLVEAPVSKVGIHLFAFLLAIVQHGVVDFFLIPSSNLGGWIATAMFVGIWVWVVRDFRILIWNQKWEPI